MRGKRQELHEFRSTLLQLLNSSPNASTEGE
jgi:hypothetical protein